MRTANSKLPHIYILQIVAVLVVLLIPTNVLAAPYIVWDNGNHNWATISDSNGNLTAKANGGVVIPDTLNIPCPNHVSAAQFNNQTCFVAPNDGHTYTVTAWSLIAAGGRGGTCSDVLEITGDVYTAGGGTGLVTPVACSTALVHQNAVVGLGSTPTTAANTPTPPTTLTGGARINYVPTISATTTPQAVDGTLSIQRST